MQLVIGRIGRAHGVRGDLFVEPMTDEPDHRYADGTVLKTLITKRSLSPPQSGTVGVLLFTLQALKIAMLLKLYADRP